MFACCVLLLFLFLGAAIFSNLVDIFEFNSQVQINLGLEDCPQIPKYYFPKNADANANANVNVNGNANKNKKQWTNVQTDSKNYFNLNQNPTFQNQNQNHEKQNSLSLSEGFPWQNVIFYLWADSITPSNLTFYFTTQIQIQNGDDFPHLVNFSIETMPPGAVTPFTSESGNGNCLNVLYLGYGCFIFPATIVSMRASVVGVYNFTSIRWNATESIIDYPTTSQAFFNLTLP